MAALSELRARGKDAEPAADAIRNYMIDPNEKVVLAAVEAIEKVRPDLYKPLSTMVLDKDWSERHRALTQLGDLGRTAFPGKSVIVAKLKVTMAPFDHFPDGRGGFDESKFRELYPLHLLIECLGKIDPEDPDRIAALKELAADYSPPLAPSINRSRRLLSMSATDAIGFLHKWASGDETKRKDILPLLKIALEKGDTPAVLQALGICAEYGNLAGPMFPRIRELKFSPDGQIRDAAKKAADRIENA